MELSPKLAAKFEQLQNRYPVKRSALIPMMMYAQDEYGSVTDEIIGDRAASRPQHCPGRGNAGVLLHAAPQARGQASRAGLHEYRLHAAGRKRIAGAREEAAGD